MMDCDIVAPSRLRFPPDWLPFLGNCVFGLIVEVNDRIQAAGSLLCAWIGRMEGVWRGKEDGKGELWMTGSSVVRFCRADDEKVAA